eukprot:450075-Pleurochrysis_carterae.AAC.15
MAYLVAAKKRKRTYVAHEETRHTQEAQHKASHSTRALRQARVPVKLMLFRAWLKLRASPRALQVVDVGGCGGREHQAHLAQL